MTATQHLTLLLVPFFALSQLIAGPRNAAGVLFPRNRVSSAVISFVAFLPFMAATLLAVAGIEYPWWIALVAGACGALPHLLRLGGLGRERAGEQADDEALALSQIARNFTIALGLVFVMLSVLVGFPVYPLIGFFAFLTLAVMAVGWSSSWGLPAIGSEWGRWQWSGFGTAGGVLAGVALLITRTAVDQLTVGIVGGVIIAGAMGVAAFAPARIR